MSGQHSPADLSSSNGPNPMRVRYFLIVFLISLFFLGRILYPFWSILVLSFILASLFRPIYLFFNKKLPDGFSSILTCLLIITLVFIPLVFFILALSNEEFLIFASNAFAILGLRAMYFLLADAKERFHYLNHALGAILIFVGLKMTLSLFFHLNQWISLGIIAALLVGAVVFSERKTRQLAESRTGI